MGWTFKFYAEGENRDLGPYYLEMWYGDSGDKFQTLLLRITSSCRTSTRFLALSRSPTSVGVAPTNLMTRGHAPAIPTRSTPQPNRGRAHRSRTRTTRPTWTTREWDCVGDIDKRNGGDESWFCESYGACSGNVDTSDSADESWETSWSFFGLLGDGDIDKSDPGDEEWQCDEVATGLSCSSETHPWEWTCDGDYRGDWTCSGTVGRLAPIVGPVSADFGEW